MERHQDATEDILAWDAIGQVQRLDEELLLQRSPLGDRSRSVGTGQDRHQGDDDHADQRVLQIDRGAGVFQLMEMPDDLVYTVPLEIRHGWPAVRRGRWILPRDVYKQSNEGASVKACHPCSKCALALAPASARRCCANPIAVLLLGCMDSRTAGSKGGLATLEKHGRSWMSEIGKRGLAATAERYFAGDVSACMEWLRLRAAEKQIAGGIDSKLQAELDMGKAIACEEVPVLLEPGDDPSYWRDRVRAGEMDRDLSWLRW